MVEPIHPGSCRGQSVSCVAGGAGSLADGRSISIDKFDGDEHDHRAFPINTYTLVAWEAIMPGRRYRVVFEGKIAEGLQVQEVKRNLASLFRTSEDQIERFFSGKRLAIKKDVDYQTAVKYVEALERAGAICKAEALEPQTDLEPSLELEKDVAKASQPDVIICPKCQFEQEETEECIRCGVVIKKFAQRAQPPEVQEVPRGVEDDLTAFVGNNANVYIQKFKKFNMGGANTFAITWNWSTFFFGPCWMLYRKLYGWAVVAFVLSAIPFTSLISTLAFAMTGNYIYFKHANKRISELKRSRPSSELTAALASVGGVNQWVVTLSIVTIIVGFIGSGLFIGYTATREATIGKISFVKDYNRGLDQAYETGKPVMLIFSAEWCGACKTMIREVFSDDEVAEASEQLVNIYIDVDKVDRKLINDYQVKYVPSIFFLDYSGETIIRVAGKRAPRDFINNMNYMYQMHSYSEQE